MSAALDETLAGLDDCGCCEGVDAAVPVEVENRPGLPAVAYRVGRWQSFRESLLARLSSAELSVLQPLTARADDFTPALLDAWAVVGDVLTFYQERIANEQYLRTATERRSILELARSIGYELAPGAAAATWLAFTLEDAPGAPAEVAVAEGTRAQSIPGPGEKPQTFETVEEVAARPGWNSLAARRTMPQAIGPASKGVWVRSAGASVLKGDRLLLEEGAKWEVIAVESVTRDGPGDRTWLAFSGAPAESYTPGMTLRVFRQQAALFGHNAPDYRLISEAARLLYEAPAKEPTRTSWSQFPNYALDPAAIDLDAVYPKILPGSRMVLLSGSKKALITVASTQEVSRADFALSARVTRVVPAVPNTLLVADFPLAGTTVLAQSEKLALADEDIAEPVRGDRVKLAAKMDAFDGPRTVIVCGRTPRLTVKPAASPVVLIPSRKGAKKVELAADDVLVLLAAPAGAAGKWTLAVRDARGNEGTVVTEEKAVVWLPALKEDAELAEVTVVDRVDVEDPDHPVLMLHAPLAYAYDRATCNVAANVARATHGEAVAEALGSGNAGTEWPRFSLRQPPLTYVPQPASTSGVESTLEVRVDQLKWTEVPTLYGHRPHERVYTTRRHDDGTTEVQFGDGITGARLPTGRENVKAAYRKGIGVEGNVRAGQLSLLMTRALGLRSVLNPIAATGGQEPQEMADARENAPLTLLTMGRIVSLRDYRDFARGYAGVGKAHAVWTWDAGRRGVYVTVAGVDGASIPTGSTIRTGLVTSLSTFGDAHVPARVVSHRAVPFHVQAVVHCHPDYLPDLVRAAVEAALAERFGFAAQKFGERVALSHVEAVMQGVAGVAWVEVTALHRDDAPSTREPWLPAAAPEAGADANTLQGAELLTIELRAGDITAEIP
jgi:hypothetical protein